MNKPHNRKDHMNTAEGAYAGLNETEGCWCYIGGKYYGSSEQIHLSKSEARELYKWLSKHFKPKENRDE